MTRRLTCITTSDEADWELLRLANEKGKFAIEARLVLGHHLQDALERGIDAEWFRLVDVGAVAAAPGRLRRVFRLTDSGWARRERLLLDNPEWRQ